MIWIIALLFALAAWSVYFFGPPAGTTPSAYTNIVQETQAPVLTGPELSPAQTVMPPNGKLVGPRQNIPVGTPDAYGFWSFSEPVPGVLSRSGQPLLSEFQWLKANGWVGDVDLRYPGEYGEVAEDDQILGFNQLGFHYLNIPMRDGAAPTDAQAQEFLDFVTNPANQPVEVHCRGGFGRTGVMIALYRYQVQGWSLDDAIAESRLYNGGIDQEQAAWLQAWAGAHPH